MAEHPMKQANNCQKALQADSAAGDTDGGELKHILFLKL